MKRLITNRKIQLKNNPEINEAMIQEFIFNDPPVIGLGELTSIRREKTQPDGGGLDILLADSDNNNRYEVEVQLGATDPSHIIRTIEYWDSLFANVYINDVIERNKIRNSDILDDLVNVLASSIGSLTNPTIIENTYCSSKKSNCSHKTISAYIKYLEDAFLISEASRYDIKGRKYIGTNKKYYFVDVGLRNVRLGLRQQEPTHLMENIIYNELKTRGFKVDVGNIERNEKNKEGISVRKQLEVDFVANRGNERYYIQSAYKLENEEKWVQEKGR